MSNLYVIRTPSGLRKVGYSRDPRRRCSQLSCDFGAPCVLEYSAVCPADMVRAAEKHAHALLRVALIGGEMFQVNAETARAAVDAAIAMTAAGEPPQAPPSRDGKTERFEMRCSSEMTAALDYLRRRERDVPTRAEMVRRIVDRKHEEMFGPRA